MRLFYDLQEQLQDPLVEARCSIPAVILLTTVTQPGRRVPTSPAFCMNSNSAADWREHGYD
jgi:hypothetical protein